MPISLQDLKKQGKINIVIPKKIVKPVKPKADTQNPLAELNTGLVKNIGKTILNVGQVGSNIMSKIPGVGGG